MKIICIVFILSLVCILQAGQVSADTIVVQYDYNGNPIGYLMPFLLDNSLAFNDYFKITWPVQLYSMAKTDISFSLNSGTGTLLAQAKAVDDLSGIFTIYFVTFNVAISAGTWYQLILWTPIIVTSVTTGMVQIETTSDYRANYITYDRNLAFGYFYIEPSLVTQGNVGTMSIVATPFSAIDANIASKIYNVYLDITPINSNSNGGNFTIRITYNSTNIGSNYLSDFQFIGICQSSCSPSPCMIPYLNYCNIDQTLSIITFSIGSFQGGQPIRIIATILNPIYASTRALSVSYVDFISGKVMQNGYLNPAFTVSPIPLIDLGSSRLQLLWGINSDYTDGNTSTIPIGIYQAAATGMIGPLNSMKIGFQISAASPINAQYTISISILATGILEGSIVHNFPSVSNNPVFCNYVSPNIQCSNIGALVNLGFTYFISFKAYYSSSIASLTGFGTIQINSVAYDPNGNLIPSVNLFSSLPPMTTPPKFFPNSQYLDTLGIHSSTYGVRYAQIVSYVDDGTKYSIGNAIQGFLRNTNTTVGIIPNLGVSQQLLFLLNVPSPLVGGGFGNLYEMKVLYNNHVIGFENGTSGMGIDFVGYSFTNNNWTIQTIPCYQTGHVVTQKYADNMTALGQRANTQISVKDSNQNPLYGLMNFQCGQSVLFPSASTICTSPDCLSQCSFLRGFNGLDLSGGVFSMRHVTFPSNYFHSSLYADSNLLDFVITFVNNGNTISSSLINAYTIQPIPMKNIKAAYVNYYDGPSIYNKGVKIPTMIRIGGGILANESRGANTIAIFFDKNVDSRTLMSSPSSSYTIGCSTQNCVYYPCFNVNIPQDFWHLSSRVEFHNLPPIQNQFNLLVPIIQKMGFPPSSMTIAFLINNNTINNVTGLYTVVAAYRLFGPTLFGNINIPISNINNLKTTTTPPLLDIDFASTNWFDSSIGGFNYQMNTNNIISNNPPNNTLSSLLTPATITVNSNYGGGITITSLGYNIFGSLYIQNFPNISCATLSYVYSQATPISANLERKGQTIYLAYCPIDSTLNLESSQGDVILNNPSYPQKFVTGYPLSTVFTYGLSNANGQLIAYSVQLGSINYVRNCTTNQLNSYYPNSPGLQRSTFNIYHDPIILASIPNGYPNFGILLTIPNSIILNSLTLVINSSLCDVSLTFLTCSIVNLTTNTVFLKFTLVGTTAQTFNNYTFNLYAQSSTDFGPQNNYMIQVYLPQTYSAASATAPYGDQFTVMSQFCSCNSSFTVATTSYSPNMTISNLSLESLSAGVPGTFSFNFQFQYRDSFYQSQSLQINFGFLQSPNNLWLTRNPGLNCFMYTNNNGVLKLSNLWKSMDFTSFPNVIIKPKAEISNPYSYVFTFKCTGGATPDNSISTQLSTSWFDPSGVTVQISSPNISAIVETASITFTNPIILTKRFNTIGQLAYYTFQITLDSAITPNAYFYVQFPSAIISYFNSDKQIECYLRLTDNPLTNDQTALRTYCSVIQERRISVSNNMALANGSIIFLDIFQIQQPKNTDISSSSIISITLDLDSNYTNGTFRYKQITEISPSASVPGNIAITSILVTPLTLYSIQNISIAFTLSTTLFSTIPIKLYLLLPASYAIWSQRGYIIPNSFCTVTAASAINTILSSSCIYISLRSIEITISTSSIATNFILNIFNISSPTSLGNLYNNNQYFNLFISPSDQSAVSYYSIQTITNPITLLSSISSYTRPNPLGWFTSTQMPITTFPITIYLGYYQSSILLEAWNYPSAFLSTFTFNTTNYDIKMISFMKNNQVDLGYPVSSFKLAANPAYALSTFYYLFFNKSSGDSQNYYLPPPPLPIIVSNTICSLFAIESNYTIPIAGSTLPIIINATNCIPLYNISITLNFSNFGSQLSSTNDLSNSILDPNTLDGKMYFVVKHTAGSLTAGQNIIVNFQISGSSSAYYSSIPPITLISINSSTLNTPASTNVLGPYISLNSANFVMQCSTPSIMYWGVGIYPSILNMTVFDFEARIISASKGLQTNFTEPQDQYFRVYGVQYSSVQNTQLNFTVNTFKSNSYYEFKYFCINQNNMASEAQAINFYSYNTNANMIKILLSFNSSLYYQQINNLACSLAQNFVVPYARVLTSIISNCYKNSSVFYKTSTSTLIEPRNQLTGYYIYQIYVIPDYSVANDTTNLVVGNILSNYLFASQLMSSTTNGNTFPWLAKIESVIISTAIIPTITLVSVIPTMNGANFTTSFSNSNGYIVLAAMKGLFYANMTVPSTFNIKNGILYNNTLLNAVYMIYNTQNTNLTIQVNTLQAGTNYTLYYFSTVDDPSYSAASSAVSCMNLTTISQVNIRVDYETWLLSGLLLLIISILI